MLEIQLTLITLIFPFFNLGFLLSEDIKLTDLNVMKLQQEKLQEFVDAARSQEKNLMAINSSSTAISPEIGSVDELKARYSEVKALLEERAEHVKSRNLTTPVF